MTNDSPPAFDPVSTIELRSTEASKIVQGRRPGCCNNTWSNHCAYTTVTEKALSRCRIAVSALESYLFTVRTGCVPSDKLGQILRDCDAEGEQLDVKGIALEAKLGTLNAAIEEERTKLAGGLRLEDQRLGLTATIGVFAFKENEVEIALIYAVHGATWRAGYDIRVNMQASEKPVTFIYKAIIVQNTGESLWPWRLSVYQTPSSPPVMATSWSMPVSWSVETERERVRGPAMIHAPADISNQGSLSTTFQVPGLVSIPCDGENHNVTIISLALDATMSWICIPRVDKRVHLKAKVKNASEYPFLPGEAGVYVDGSFISKSNVPAVSPQESFDCSLGIDSSIRVTYHPLSRNLSYYGFYSKTTKRSFTQRVTIFNSKSKLVDDLKIMDHVPISEDSQICVKLINPPLILPASSTLGTASGTDSSSKNRNTDSGKGKGPEKGKKALIAPVKVSEGVIAQWDGADELESDISALGKEGKFNWSCKIPSQGTANLTLQWEVHSPADVTVTGL